MKTVLRMRKNEAALFMIKKVAGQPRTYVVQYIRKLVRISEARVPPEIAV
jgi:hypothetical protein